MAKNRRKQLSVDLFEEIEEEGSRSQKPKMTDEFGRDTSFYQVSLRRSRRDEHNNRRQVWSDRHPDQAREFSDVEDGWSTDDETAEDERLAFQERRDAVVDEVSHLLDDTAKEYSSLQVAKARLETWKFKFSQTYKDAYVSLSLRAVVEFFIRMELVGWNPLEKHTPLASMQWFRILQSYGEGSGEIDDEDEDLDLISKIVEKTVIPNVTGKKTPHCSWPPPWC